MFVAIGLIASSAQFTKALFSDEVAIENNTAETGIWNPGKATITEVFYDPTGADLGHEWIKIRNTGGYNLPMAGYILHFNGLGTNHFIFPDIILEPSNEIVVHLRLAGTNTGTDLYWPNTGDVNMNNASGSVSLFKSLPKNASNIIDFVQYGAASQNQETNAAAAGIWTAGAFVADAQEGYSLRLTNNSDHNSVADWEPNQVE